MSTTSKTMSTNSFGFNSPKSSSTCNICKRLLYSFEEILVCRICHGSYHWRCVKPETISHYGENTHFICDKCNENITTTTTTTATTTHRLSNGGIRIKSPDSSETDYRNFVGIPSKLNTTPAKDTTVVNAVRYFEEKQQQQQQIPSTQKMSKLNEVNGHHSNGQSTDDSKTIRRIQPQQQQQQTNFESDEENTTTGMFQADYQYTPLKEYAAMKNGRTSSHERNTNGYQTTPSPNSEPQSTSRYDGSLPYTTKSSTHFTSPTIDNITVHNRQQHFTSSTNLNVNEISTRHQPHNHSTPYLSAQIRDNQSPTFKSSQQQQQQLDRHSNVESDSGIVIVNSTHPHPINDDNQVIERKLTGLVQQLGKQLETDAQKLSEKLELKLKNLEYMIHQQTYIIRRQDEVIERMKTKILKIESERDHFRDRLSIHEQREHDGKKYGIETMTDDTLTRKLFEHDDQQLTLNDVSTNRKFSTSSSVTTEQSRRSSKKTAAPRVDQHGVLVNNDNESAVSKFIKTVPTNQERPVSDPSIASKLVAAVPIVEKPAAASRLDDIIHQSNNESNPTSSYYNTPEGRPNDLTPSAETITTTRQDTGLKAKRSVSSSSTSSSSSSSAVKPQLPSTLNTGLPPRNSNYHRSLESLPRKTSQTERTLNPSNKTTSLEFGKRPVGYEDPGSIYITPQEATHPASEYHDVTKGWVRKQNRDSFFKRIERYYCVLSDNVLMMHKHQQDTKAQKAVNLRGAKVVQYEDQRHGPSLELTWSRRNKELKRYHLFPSETPNAQQWTTAIQTAIQNLDNKNLSTKDAAPENKWQRYPMQT